MTTPEIRWFVVGLISVASVLLPASAQGTQKFPPAIYYYLYPTFKVKPYTPPCSLCHSRGSTGPGTANTPFALSGKARGLLPGNTPSLDTSLAAMDKDEVDSDGDGVPDIQELRDGTDPNTPGDVNLVSESGPNAGCGASAKPPRTTTFPANTSRDSGAFILAVPLLTLLRRRRRRS